MTKDRKEKEDDLVHLDSQDLLDLREPLGVLEVPAPRVSFDFTILEGGGGICGPALT